MAISFVDWGSIVTSRVFSWPRLIVLVVQIALKYDRNAATK